MDLFIEKDLIGEIVHFEDFFQRMGFKRIDGSVFGLLVLSKRPLTSEEIEATLNLSQSAISISLKSLAQIGAIESRDNRDTKAKIHTAKEDSLSIVASVFRKREEEYVAEFKKMAQRVLNKTTEEGENSSRKKRMISIIQTCEIAEAVMNFVITIARERGQEHFDHHYEQVVKRLPKTLELLAMSAGPISEITHTLKDNFTNKFKNNLKGIL